MRNKQEASLKDFANAVRGLLDLGPLPHDCSKEPRPYKTVERRELERFYVREIAETSLYMYGGGT